MLCHGVEMGERCGTQIGEGILGFEPHALVCVPQQAAECLWRPLGHALLQQLHRLGMGGVIGQVGLVDAVDAAFHGLVPSLHPIRKVDSRLHTKFHVGGQHVIGEVASVHHLKTGPARRKLQRVDQTPSRITAKVAHEKGVVVRFGHTRARIEGQPGGARTNVQQGRYNMGRLLVKTGRPHFLRVPRPPGIGLGDPLVADTPATVPPLDDPDPTGLITGVGVVVAREEVAVVVESQFLGIAQAPVHDFEVAAIQIASKDRAGIGFHQSGTVGKADVDTPVANTEVKTAVGTLAESMEVVAQKVDMDPITGAEDVPFVGHTIFVSVREAPEFRYAGVVEVTPVEQETRANTRQGVSKSIGKDGGLVGDPIAIGIPEFADAVMLFRPHGKLGTQVLLHGNETIFHGAGGEIIDKPIPMSAHVPHPPGMAKGLGDIDVAVEIEIEGYRIGQEGLGGHEVHGEAFGRGKRRNRLCALVRGFRNVGKIGGWYEGLVLGHHGQNTGHLDYQRTSNERK